MSKPLKSVHVTTCHCVGKVFIADGSRLKGRGFESHHTLERGHDFTPNLTRLTFKTYEYFELTKYSILQTNTCEYI